MKLDTLVAGGTLVDPEAGTAAFANVGIAGGRIAYIGPASPQAARTLDAAGLLVCPGFVDTHMHDEELDDPEPIQRALLRQGVTTAIAGQCGLGPAIEAYEPRRRAPRLKLGYMTGHLALRRLVGLEDAYRPAGADETERMRELLRAELARGSFGLSFGLEYAPNTRPEEIAALASVLEPWRGRWISIHIRTDGPECLGAMAEAIALARAHRVRVQVSHIGSMTAFGYSAQALRMIEEGRAEGLELGFDCYPYDAFCTSIGSAVFDPGFERRWNKGLEALEAASGKYKGRVLTPESYADLRASDPEALIVAHVMDGAEVRRCLAHPLCAIASDGILKGGQGHPRAAGSFPRALRILREAGLSWPEAVRHATSLPASMAWLEAGRIAVGSAADLVAFDPERLRDRATFSDQLAPPEGIAFVLVDGAVAVEAGEVALRPSGRLLLRAGPGPA